MIASHHLEQSPSIRECYFFNLFNPSPIDAHWHFMFRFTCSCTSMAATTFSIVYDKAIFHLIAFKAGLSMD